MADFVPPPQVVALEAVLEKLTISKDRVFALSLIRDSKRKALSASQLYWVERLTRRAKGTEKSSSTKGKKLVDKSQIGGKEVVKEIVRETTVASADVETVVARCMAELDKRVPRETRII